MHNEGGLPGLVLYQRMSGVVVRLGGHLSQSKAEMALSIGTVLSRPYLLGGHG